MNKKLPNVFVNKIDKKIDNNKMVFYSSQEEKQTSTIPEEISIYDKMNQIYQNVPFMYKKEVEITLKDRSFVTKIISYNKKNLITLDNQIILLDQILDIKLKTP